MSVVIDIIKTPRVIGPLMGIVACLAFTGLGLFIFEYGFESLDDQIQSKKEELGYLENKKAYFTKERARLDASLAEGQAHEVQLMEIKNKLAAARKQLVDTENHTAKLRDQIGQKIKEFEDLIDENERNINDARDAARRQKIPVLELLNGEKFQQVEIIKIDNLGIRFSYQHHELAGFRPRKTVGFNDLPKDLQDRFQFVLPEEFKELLKPEVKPKPAPQIVPPGQFGGAPNPGGQWQKRDQAKINELDRAITNAQTKIEDKQKEIKDITDWLFDLDRDVIKAQNKIMQLHREADQFMCRRPPNRNAAEGKFKQADKLQQKITLAAVAQQEKQLKQQELNNEINELNIEIQQWQNELWQEQQKPEN